MAVPGGHVYVYVILSCKQICIADTYVVFFFRDL